MPQCLIWKVRGADLQEGFQAVEHKWLRHLCTLQSWITHSGLCCCKGSLTPQFSCVLRIKPLHDLETQRLFWSILCPLCRSPFPESQRLYSVICSYRDKTLWWNPHVNCVQLHSLKLYWHKENYQRRRSEENQHLKEKYIHKIFWNLWYFLWKHYIWLIMNASNTCLVVMSSKCPVCIWPESKIDFEVLGSKQHQTAWELNTLLPWPEMNVTQKGFVGSQRIFLKLESYPVHNTHTVWEPCYSKKPVWKCPH